MNQEAGDSAQKSNLDPSRPPRRSGPPRRRGGRGRRRPAPRDLNVAAPESAHVEGEQLNAISPAESTQREPIAREEPIRGPSPVPTRPQQQPRRTGSSIAEATAQVEDVIKSLKDALRELEEVLEVLDDAQRQQIGDEKEIESLRRALSSLQRERQSSPRDESRGRYENRGRSENRNRSDEQRSPAKSPPAEPSEPAD